MTPPRILIAGIGNIFFGDDAFGSEVARRLMGRPQRLPDGVHVGDFGIRGLDLTYALLDGYEAIVLVDATPRGGTPGTLYVIEPEAGDPGRPEDSDPTIPMHSLDPVEVLRLTAALGGQPKRVLLVGCEPETLGTDEEPALGLSATVESAVDQAIPLIDSLVARLLAETRIPAMISPAGTSRE
jgi:hydrogenase maturation protease